MAEGSENTGGDSARAGGIHFDVDVRGVAKVQAESERAGAALKKLGADMTETAGAANTMGAATGNAAGSVSGSISALKGFGKAVRGIKKALFAIPFAVGLVVSALTGLAALFQKLAEQGDKGAEALARVRGEIYESLRSFGQFPEDPFEKQLESARKVAQANAVEIAARKDLSNSEKADTQERNTRELNASQERILARKREAEEAAKHAGEGKAAVEAARADAARERQEELAHLERVRLWHEERDEAARREAARRDAERIEEIRHQEELNQLEQRRAAEMQKFVTAQNALFNGSNEPAALQQIVNLLEQLNAKTAGSVF